MTKFKTPSIICLLYFSFICSKLSGQNIFPQKVEGCNTPRFCLDCGDPKAVYDSISFAGIAEKINSSYNLNGIRGRVIFQVLVDSIGNGCVISHTDASNNPITKDLIKYLNACKWVAAKEKNKAVSSSINVQFSIINTKISGKIQRIDPVAMSANMKNPGTPVIYNKTYKYNNPSLNNYEITIWQKENSGFPNDMNTIDMVDKTDIVWCATINGMARFDGQSFSAMNKSNSPFKSNGVVNAIAVDKENNKWFSYDDTLFKFNNTNWERYDSTKTSVAGAYHIVAGDNGEMFFCAENGLLIYKNGKWDLLDNKRIKQLPANRVYYAFRDKKQRLWIGTFKGSIMIDAENNVTEFNKTDGPLKDICISGAAIDDQGNIYFIPYAFKDKERNSENEGLVILTKDNKWVHYNDTNSGLPANHINSILYDKFENLLWIGTNGTGLVRFDLKNGWENYHNENSKVPSSYIFAMSQDSKGATYVSTYYGMMRISKK